MSHKRRLFSKPRSIRYDQPTTAYTSIFQHQGFFQQNQKHYELSIRLCKSRVSSPQLDEDLGFYAEIADNQVRKLCWGRVGPSWGARTCRSEEHHTILKVPLVAKSLLAYDETDRVPGAGAVKRESVPQEYQNHLIHQRPTHRPSSRLDGLLQSTWELKIRGDCVVVLERLVRHATCYSSNRS
jgi:hypothetical protein